MLVRECSPGDLVEARGWEVIIARTKSSTAYQLGLETAYLIPAMKQHRDREINEVDMAYRSSMLYLGPVYGKNPVSGISSKLHHFLTDRGLSIGLHGSEFKYLNPCKK